MSFATQALRYGWVALASLGALTGTTIYVLNNQRHQVKPEDIIEIALGVTERCLATQTSTNPVTYDVDPPSFVRTWYSNVYVYTSNGVVIYTNVVTNTIGWHTDREMLISLDTTIKSLVPYFINTNMTTNFGMLTVTGLWASLNIGDGTNRFTREPAWTNIVTNWVVNYTSYWPSTNGVAVTNCYTSDYRQVVNYAASWTATGGHVWVTSSNWASEVVIVTNAATYNDYPWQIYAEDLEERYKVLNALKATRSYIAARGFYGPSVTWEDSWEVAKSYAEIHFQVEWGKGFYGCFTQGEKFLNTNWWFALVSSIQITSPDVSSFSTSVSFNARAFIKPDLPVSFPRGYSSTNLEYAHFDDNGLGVALNTWYEITNFPFGLSFGPPKEVPVWCPNPAGSPVIVLSEFGDKIQLITKGFTIPESGQVLLVDWNFSYCTNKYW